MNAIDLASMNQLNAERKARVMDALYYIGMSNADTQDLKTICAELQIDYNDLRNYRPKEN